ncbi:MAG: GNAT family N-acetyltransferase [Proteobacteria bacterium]|nr:GNAT family N-acetyltransferase [Pseudomonadota bacterium]
MTAATLRLAGAADAAALSLVGRATFLETFAGVLDGDGILEHCEAPHSAETYARWLGDGQSRLWLAEAAHGGAPIGYAVLSQPDLPAPDPTEGDLELKRIYLLSRFHGGGLGSRLMDMGIREARSMGRTRLLLGVYAQNDRAIGFYQRHGFSQVGVRRFRVGRREYDDAVMARAL